MFDNTDREAIVGVIRDLVCLIHHKAVHSSADDPTLTTLVSQIRQLTATVLASALNSVPAGNQRLSEAAYADLMIRQFAEFSVHGGFSKEGTDDLVCRFITALGHTSTDLWSKYEVKLSETIRARHLNFNHAVMSPAMYEVLVRINPDRVRTEKDLQQLGTVITAIESENYQHSKNEVQDARLLLSARLVNDEKVSAADLMFFHGAIKSKDDYFKNRYSEHVQNVNRVQMGWQQDLLTSTVIHTWVYHPEKSVDYDEFASIVNTHDVGNYSPSLIAAATMQDTHWEQTASTSYSRNMLLKLHAATHQLTK